MTLLDDIDKDTVDFTPNYDGSREEPQVLPARFPNLLVNGAGGIAVGMATNIPPHNLGEVIAACKAYIDNPRDHHRRADRDHPRPRFPDRPLILGQAGARSAYHTGRGSIIMRARHEVEEGRGDRRSIVLTSIPYQVGKNGLVEKIAEAAKDKRIEGVSDIRDESNREGVRVVIDLKRDATPDVVLNQLWRHTPAQSSFPANMLAIRGGRPETLTLRDIIEAFVKLPRGGDHPARQVRARQGARPGPHLARPRHRGHQSRRGGADHPRLRLPGRGARRAARARLADRRDRALYRAGRGGRDRDRGRRPTACPTRRSARSSSFASTG